MKQKQQLPITCAFTHLQHLLVYWINQSFVIEANWPLTESWSSKVRQSGMAHLILVHELFNHYYVIDSLFLIRFSALFSNLQLASITNFINTVVLLKCFLQFYQKALVSLLILTENNSDSDAVDQLK